MAGRGLSCLSTYMHGLGDLGKKLRLVDAEGEQTVFQAVAHLGTASHKS